MICDRCQGHIVREWIREGMIASLAWRCVLCGDITDGVIRLHRALSRPPSPGRARTLTYASAQEAGFVVE